MSLSPSTAATNGSAKYPKPKRATAAAAANGNTSASTSEEVAAPAAPATKEKAVSSSSSSSKVKPVVILVGRPEATEQDKPTADAASLAASESGTTSETPSNDDEKEESVSAAASKEESRPDAQISCSRCHLAKSAKSYNNEERARGLKGNKARCSSCVAFRSLLKRRFNLTLAVFDIKRSAQGDRCALCKTESILEQHKIDFDETAKTFRGIVCDKCFARIKTFPEPPLIIDSVVDTLVYLVKSSKEMPESEATAKVLKVCEAFGVLVKLPK